MYDLLIVNGRVIDGTGNPWFKTNVAVKDGKIFEIGTIGGDAKKTIDADGLIVSPGFIDIHTHSDWPLIENPLAESKIRQGVTTEVTGNCGTSGVTSGDEKTQTEFGIKIDWATLDGYKEVFDRQGVAVNVAPLAGLGAISTAVIGPSTEGPDRGQLDEMKALLEQALRNGAFGASNGLTVWRWAKRCDERLIELVSVVRKYNGIYATHRRNEGDYVIDSLLEEIEICERAGVPLQISHHKHNGYENFGTVDVSLRFIKQARARGLEVTIDNYPYTATGSSLLGMLPPRVQYASFEERRKMLADPEFRKTIKREALTAVTEGEKYYSQVKNSETGDLRSYMVRTISDKHKDLLGKRLGDVAMEQGLDQWDYAYDLLMEEKDVGVIRFSLSEDDVIAVMRDPLTMIGSDGSALATYGPLSEGHPHPRNYGTYPRVLGRYVRELGVLSLEDAIRKMTSYPALRLGLKDRGVLREGTCADITIFDPLTVKDKATYDNPQQYPEGIEYVIVNGVTVIDKGEHLKTLPGKFLQRGK